MTMVSGRPGPSIVHGFSRTARTSAPALRCRANGERSDEVPMRWIAFARPARLIAYTGAPHPSIAVVGRALADEALGHLADVDLQRMRGVEVAVGRPAVRDAGEQHGGVLARAVHPHRVRATARRARPRRAWAGRRATRADSRGRPRRGRPHPGCRARPRRGDRCPNGSPWRAPGARPRAVRPR